MAQQSETQQTISKLTHYAVTYAKCFYWFNENPWLIAPEDLADVIGGSLLPKQPRKVLYAIACLGYKESYLESLGHLSRDRLMYYASDAFGWHCLNTYQAKYPHTACL